MVHCPEQTPSITKALVDLACANRLTLISHDQYKDVDGNTLTMTELGFVDTDNFNYKLLYHDMADKYNDLMSDIDAMKSEKAKLAVQNKEISAKTIYKARNILNGNIPDGEKIILLRKYLN